MDWHALFVPTIDLWEIFLRGTIIYLFLFFLLRVLRREGGQIGIADVLVVVLIADASQNAMASNYQSITEGIVLVSTIAFWDYLLDWLGYHSPLVQRLLRSPPLLLIKDGQIQRRNLRQEMISVDELMSQLREQGIDAVSKVKKCYLEGDGCVSVIVFDAAKPAS
ncbi:MAG TPA: DUF421 domain-containing protein [Thiobacillus sp.]|nr:MAG: hypothetical protein B7Y50_06975 [Hydrogenophilales bacterium 28-61-11]OYZ56755.1 MAG: hypothetical protein B7Y21_10375 [Hydrogenophilales bacterium 16-61-112]OZA48911.1 MAG: hypothetical protein B7X81_03265 [Hydrogenophilales bacterium 17-61-76]HQT30004.1 DUF421 domain-containing protein [Thiobacillus sp.]HQT70912.1 DUF421 domain-containing protein [Thiobacillus sp.]